MFTLTESDLNKTKTTNLDALYLQSGDFLKLLKNFLN